jgi:uncharacterized protein (TIGR02246 family)
MSSDKPMSRQSDKETIRKWFKNYLGAVRKGDYEAYPTYYTEDVVMLPPNHPALYGIDTLVQMAKANFDRYNVEVDVTIEEILVDDSIALARLSVIEVMIPKGDGESLKDDRKTLFIFRRNADGSWSASHCMWNSNLSAS